MSEFKVFKPLLAVSAAAFLSEGVSFAQDLKITAPEYVCGYEAEVSVPALDANHTGHWSSPMSNIWFNIDTHGIPIKVSGLQRGENVIFWTVYDLNGQKVDEASAVIRSNQVWANIYFNYGDDVVCDDKVRLSGSVFGEASGIWTCDNEEVEYYYTPTAAITDVGNLRKGGNKFTWTVTSFDGKCQDSQTVTIHNNQVKAEVRDELQTAHYGVGYLAADNLYPDEYGYWSVDNPNSSAEIARYDYSNTYVTNLDKGMNVFTWHVSSQDGKCTDFAKVTILNESVEAEILTGDGEVVCDGSVKLKAKLPKNAYGVWSAYEDNSKVVFENSTAETTVVTNLSPGENSFVWRVFSNDGQSADSRIVTVVNRRMKTFDYNNEPELTCNSEGKLYPSVFFYDGFKGYWTVDNPDSYTKLDNPQNSYTLVRYLEEGPNFFTWHVSSLDGKCTATEQHVIKNNAVYAYIYPVDYVQEVCDGTVKLSAYSPQNSMGVWSCENNSDVVFIGQTTNNTLASNLAKGDNKIIWKVTSFDGKCQSEDFITIKNNAVTAKVLNNEITNVYDRGIVACNDEMELYAEPLNQGYGYWSVDNPKSQAVIINSAEANTVVTNLDKGQNVFSWNVFNGGCTASKQIFVQNSSFEAHIFNNDGGRAKVICENEYNLSAYLPEGATGEWESVVGDVFFDDKSSCNTVVRNLENNVYHFAWTVTSPDGICKYQDVITLINKKVTPEILSCEINPDGTGFLKAAQLKDDEGGYWTEDYGILPSVVFENSYASETGFSGLEPGMTTFRWVVWNDACKDFDEVAVNNEVKAEKEKLTAQILTEDGEITCDGTVKLYAFLPEGAKGYWTADNQNVIFEIYSAPVTVAKNLVPGSNFFCWTVTDGESTASQKIMVENNSVMAEILNNDGETTETSDCLLQGVKTNNAKGYWTTCSSKIVFEELSDGRTVAKNLVKGENCFTWNVISSDGRCSAYKELKVVSNPAGEIETPVGEMSKAFASNVKIWAFEKTVFVEGAESEISIADMTGRIIKKVAPASDFTEIRLETSGVYVVRTGVAAKKVVIR